MKISSLPQATSASNSDELALVQSGSTKRVSKEILINPERVTGTGSITVTVANDKEYDYTAVTSLTMTGTAVDAHGFITFGSNPTISVSGFDASSGDDITGAGSGEVWEFSCMEHNSKSYIVWKKWA